MKLNSLLLFAALAAAPSPAAAQEHAPAPATTTTAPAAAEEKGAADVIMEHITDSKHLEYPCFKSWKEWSCHLTFPTWNVHLAGRTFDMGPTRHVFFMFLAALITCALLITTAQLHARHSKAVGHPKGRAAGLEAIILYLRQEIYLQVLGHGGEKYVPFALTLFFFVFFCNLLGLFPWGASATGNIAVTATLALITLVTVEVAGMKALGAGYINTILYWSHDVGPVMRVVLAVILTPIELLGKLTKPFALTVRLFANMVAGHVILLAFMGLMVSFGWGLSGKTLLSLLGGFMSLFMMGLELMVAAIQAFIFSVLAAVFIGQIREAHH